MQIEAQVPWLIRFFKLIVPANLRIQIGETIQVEVKKSVLTGVMPATHPDMIDKLKTFIRSGEITSKRWNAYRYRLISNNDLSDGSKEEASEPSGRRTQNVVAGIDQERIFGRDLINK